MGDIQYACKCGETIYISGFNQDYIDDLMSSNNMQKEIIEYLLKLLTEKEKINTTT